MTDDKALYWLPKGTIGEQGAAAVIEADREAARAEVVGEIVAWLEDHDFGNYLVNGVSSGIADEIEAEFGGRDVAD